MVEFGYYNYGYMPRGCLIDLSEKRPEMYDDVIVYAVTFRDAQFTDEYIPVNIT
jgi:hypothetical protein